MHHLKCHFIYTISPFITKLFEQLFDGGKSVGKRSFTDPAEDFIELLQLVLGNRTHRAVLNG